MGIEKKTDQQLNLFDIDNPPQITQKIDVLQNDCPDSWDLYRRYDKIGAEKRQERNEEMREEKRREREYNEDKRIREALKGNRLETIIIYYDGGKQASEVTRPELIRLIRNKISPSERKQLKRIPSYVSIEELKTMWDSPINTVREYNSQIEGYKLDYGKRDK